MSDIVERLRQGAGHIPEDIIAAEEAMTEAADEIERLRAALLSLRDAYDTAETEVMRLRAILGMRLDRDQSFVAPDVAPAPDPNTKI